MFMTAQLTKQLAFGKKENTIEVPTNLWLMYLLLICYVIF